MFKKIITFALVLALCAGMISAFALTSSAAEYDGGTGTPVDPYIISSEASLKALAEAVNGGETYMGVYFELGNDIILTSNWTPIGLFDDSDATNKIDLQFCGNFNGKGHEISGLNIVSTEHASVGLFGNLGSFAVVKNVTVNGNISASARFIGGIAGITMTATIQNCVSKVTIDAKVYGGNPSVGGIVGLARTMTNIEYCVNEGNITIAAAENATDNDLYVAGIVGDLTEMCNTRYCISDADLEAKNIQIGYVGGIVGKVSGAALPGVGGIVSDCAVKGNLKSSDGVTTGCVGGVVSYLTAADHTFTNCGVLATITTPAAADGMVMTYLGYIVGNSKFAAIITNIKVSGDVLLGKNAGNNIPADCVMNVTEIDAIEFAIEDAIKAWAKVDAETVPTMPVETTTEAPVDTTAPADETTGPKGEEEETTTIGIPTTKTPDTTAKPADTTANKESGCGGFGIAQAIAVFVSIAGAAVIIKKKN